MLYEKTPSEQRLEDHLKYEEVKKKNAIKKQITREKNQKKLMKFVEKHQKNKSPEEPMVLMNTKKVWNKASDWIKRIPVSSLTEEDYEREVEFWFDNHKSLR